MYVCVCPTVRLYAIQLFGQTWLVLAWLSFSSIFVSFSHFPSKLVLVSTVSNHKTVGWHDNDVRAKKKKKTNIFQQFNAWHINVVHTQFFVYIHNYSIQPFTQQLLFAICENENEKKAKIKKKQQINLLLLWIMGFSNDREKCAL